MAKTRLPPLVLPAFPGEKGAVEEGNFLSLRVRGICERDVHAPGQVIGRGHCDADKESASSHSATQTQGGARRNRSYRRARELGRARCARKWHSSAEPLEMAETRSRIPIPHRESASDSRPADQGNCACLYARWPECVGDLEDRRSDDRHLADVATGGCCLRWQSTSSAEEAAERTGTEACRREKGQIQKESLMSKGLAPVCE